MVTPAAGELPLYVRGGTILPMAPLTQSTDEKPVGPLTLRVFPADDCKGDVYLDDGKTFDFRKGAFLRQSFSCAVDTNGNVSVTMGKVEGSFAPWWSSVRIEVIGSFAAAPMVRVNAQTTLTSEKTALGWAVTVASTSGQQTVVFGKGDQ
jgi:alpha-glucosidase